MKINPKHIHRFEAFIQEAKDTNAKNTEQTKNDKKPEQADEDEDEDEETQNDSEDEDDIVEEMKRYFAEKEKNNPNLEILMNQTT
ncbi:hypothetical protein [Mucilaginibacter sp. SP1R1]|uniref:hypothetical protein n=1 Tax=Mucilaginibacter sp. SP1R1 TaxID=2723091 RepID=UPI001610AF1E|nr:hypothetical protein [Mucilaginibacter sp. SP1R1]MBB6152754.1 Sec-independent protein translocase protein TatA [Mucilaginibacter sp. SP1R1]